MKKGAVNAVVVIIVAVVVLLLYLFVWPSVAESAESAAGLGNIGGWLSGLMA